MIQSPIEAHPMRRNMWSSDSSNDGTATPPAYTSQDAPPPYPSCTTPAQPRTLSIPFAPGVVFQWNPAAPQLPDDIILVTVRVNIQGRRESIDDPLPERPAQRGFFRRLGSRILHPYSDMDNIRAVRMPRREYLRHHKRDSEGNYAGTEPQQDWDDEMIAACYGKYQEKPLNSLYHNGATRI